MTALIYYLLKVILCSGLLFLYYQLFLRNKVFHQWNRFYLLSAVALSLVLPLFRFTVFFETKDNFQAAELLRQFQQADNRLEALVVSNPQMAAPERWLLGVYLAVSAILLLSLLVTVRRLWLTIQQHKVKLINNVRLIDTELKGTPFAFFHYIFWNRNISLQSETGRQIFQHEMVHVREGHSADKLFLQLVLIVCWCNPFFWLIRKELRSIHEFIADQKSVGHNDASSFAAMLLQAAYLNIFTHSLTHFLNPPLNEELPC